jgi:hypothetical protein
VPQMLAVTLLSIIAFFKKHIEYTFGGVKELNVVFFTMIGLTQYCICTSSATCVLPMLFSSKLRKLGEWYIKLILKCILVNTMSTRKGTRMISLISTKKKSNDTKVSWYLMGQDM